MLSCRVLLVDIGLCRHGEIHISSKVSFRLPVGVRVGNAGIEEKEG